MKYAFITALALIIAPASAFAREEQPTLRLYCSIGQRVAYFATFDSGDSDLAACKTTAAMWDALLESKGVADHKCWCTVTVSA
jgi:hypothetical protein